MTKNRSRIILAGLFVFALLLLQAGIKEPGQRNWLDRGLLTVSAPVQEGMVWLIDGAAGLWSDYVWLVGVHEENIALNKRVDELERRLAMYEDLQSENERLKSLLAMRRGLAAKRVQAARVVGVGTSPVSRVIRIDLGSKDGVKVGLAVVAGAGLVGRINNVVPAYSEVLLLVDVRSAVDVVVQRSRVRGIVRGQGRNENCSVDYLVRTADIEVGDRLVTSGLGGLFPKGLLVGTVSHTTAPDVGVFRLADLRPAVDFDELEEVLVVFAADEVPEHEGQGEREADPGGGGHERAP